MPKVPPVPRFLQKKMGPVDRTQPEESTRHVIRRGDARDLSWLASNSVHLVCTSPPYGSLKEYPDGPHGLVATHREKIVGDLLAFIRGKRR